VSRSINERLPRLRPADLDEAQAALYRSITEGQRTKRSASRLLAEDGSLNGPFNAMLFAPEIGSRLEQLGLSVRYGSRLTPRCTEIAILTVAARTQCQYEQQAHERAGRKAGLTENELSLLRQGELVDLPGDAQDLDIESLTWLLTTRLLAHQDIEDWIYERAVPIMGHDGLVELAALVGYYWSIAGMMRLFRIR